MSICLRSFLKVFISCSGSLWMPTQQPFTNILVALKHINMYVRESFSQISYGASRWKTLYLKYSSLNTRFLTSKNNTWYVLWHFHTLSHILNWNRKGQTQRSVFVKAVKYEELRWLTLQWQQVRSPPGSPYSTPPKTPGWETAESPQRCRPWGPSSSPAPQHDPETQPPFNSGPIWLLQHWFKKKESHYASHAE